MIDLSSNIVFYAIVILQFILSFIYLGCKFYWIYVSMCKFYIADLWSFFILIFFIFVVAKYVQVYLPEYLPLIYIIIIIISFVSVLQNYKHLDFSSGIPNFSFCDRVVIFFAAWLILSFASILERECIHVKFIKI